MKKVLFGALLFGVPSLVFAASFVQTPLFLSTSPVTDGEKVRVYAIVSNVDSDAFNGSVVISADGTELGSPAATLAAGGTQTVSVSWTPTAGVHTVTAELTGSDGTVVQKISQDFTVQNAPSAAPDNSTGGVQSSAQLQQSIGNFSPTAEQYSAPVLNTIDSGRAAAATQLNNAITWSKAQTGATPEVLGASTSRPLVSSSNKTASTLWTIFMTAVLYVLTALLFVVGNAGLFYPVFFILVLYILWRCWRRYRRGY